MARLAKIDIRLEGPFFHRDVKKTFRDNARALLLALAYEGAIPIRQALNEHRSNRSHGHAADGIRAELGAIDGSRWLISSAIHQTNTYPWPGGGGRVYKGGKLEAKIHIFRRVYLALRRSRKIASANLTKGLN